MRKVMIKGNGRPVYEGVAIGRIYVLSKEHEITNTKCSDIENRCCAICKQFFPKSIKCFNKYLGYRGTASGLSNLYLGLSELKSQESLLLISVNPGGLIGSIVVKKI